MKFLLDREKGLNIGWACAIDEIAEWLSVYEAGTLYIQNGEVYVELDDRRPSSYAERFKSLFGWYIAEDLSAAKAPASSTGCSQ